MTAKVHLWDKPTLGAECGATDAENVVGMSLLKEVNCPECLSRLAAVPAQFAKCGISLAPPDDCSECGKKGELLPVNHRCPCCGYVKLEAAVPASKPDGKEQR